MVRIPPHLKKIPEWDAEKPEDSFAICKGISPLPVTRLENWRHFQQFIENCYDGEIGRNLIFRGQRNCNWKLISSLGRTENSNFIHDLEETQLREFKKAIRGRIQDRSLLKKDLSEDEENELWSIGQHHGLMTPLLDWTYSAYVALFFAFIEKKTIEESVMKNDYCAVYMLDSEYFKEVARNSKIHIFEPTQDEYGRLVNQDGLFTISTLEVDIETEIFNSLYHLFNGRLVPINTSLMARFACKIYIKNIDREECLQYLEHMNVNHKILFPDLQGSAYFCNAHIESFIYNLQKSAMSGGSLMFLPKEKYKAYEKGKLYYRIKKCLNKILNDSLSKDEENEIERIDSYTKRVFKEDPPTGNLILIPQIEFLAIEITKQVEGLKELFIPKRSYKCLMEVKINLILTGFNLKGLEPIQAKKQQVIDEIMDIIKNDEE